MLTLSQGLTRDAFVSSRDMHSHKRMLFISIIFSRERDGLIAKAVLNLLVLLVVLR